MTRPSGIVTLLTDFGMKDPFVGMMKGAILARFAAARLVDLTHEIPPQDVRAGAYWLARSYLGFPPGSVHVAVVDPGVGTARPLVAVEARGQWVVAPDNGLLGDLVVRDGVGAVHAIDRVACELPEPSRTFHGRDVLAPVAADLAAGHRALSAVGPLTTLTALGYTLPRERAGRLEGEVIVRDRFGNLLTDIPTEAVARLAKAGSATLGHGLLVWVGEVPVPWRRTYSDVEVGELVALDDSHGDVEIAQRDGSAAETLGAGRGTPVRVELARGLVPPAGGAGTIRRP
ncbi:MAG: SAM-dependent chlorinase/fluorinase [Polyangiaceae bacterium]|nr:SAM-dependent chlorinase/fluorinase [Polyangiaceae bacterium]